MDVTRTGAADASGEATSLRVDAAVIGAGIIGLMCATELARRGLEVALIDDVQTQKRSYKVGESLLIFSGAFLRNVGGLDEFIQGSFPKTGVWFCYGMEGRERYEDVPEWAVVSPVPRRWQEAARDPVFFRSLFKDGQIVRPEAEDVLRENVRREPGLTFVDSALVRDLDLGDGGADHTLVCAGRGGNGTARTVRARWIVDCSGRNRLLAKRLGHDVPLDDGFQTTAAWAQFRDVGDGLFGEQWAYQHPDEGPMQRDLATMHLWGRGYWIWVIRLSNDRISVGATWDQRMAPPGKDFKERFWNLIDRYPVLQGKLSPEQALEWRTYRDVQHMTDTFVSPRRYAMAGDSASIIDALYSQGMSFALVTTWHVANIVQRDVREGTLDMKYLKRVNDATTQDWHIMRTLTRVKFDPAIADNRFFLLSHVLDYAFFASLAPVRFRLTRWLVDTRGHASLERPVHRKLRAHLERRLFFSQAPPWNLLPPRLVARVHRHLQQKLLDRARWRLANGVETRKVRCVIKVAAPMPPVWRLLRRQRGPLVDVSPTEIVEPKFLRITGEETAPLLATMAAPSFLFLFLWAYFGDWLATGYARLRLAVRRPAARRPEQVAADPSDAGD